MPTEVEVEGVGVIEFPDEMSSQDIQGVLVKQFPSPKTRQPIVSPFPATPEPAPPRDSFVRMNAITGEKSVLPIPKPDPFHRLPSQEDQFRAMMATDPVMEAVLYPGILNDKGKWNEAVSYYRKNKDSIPKEFGEKFKGLIKEIRPIQQLTRQEENELGVTTAKRDLEQAWFPNIKAAAAEGGGDIDSIVARLIGANKTADDLVRMANEYEQAAEKIDEKSIIPKVLRQGARGAMRTLPAAAGAAMVAGPYGAIGYASASEANNAYTRGKDAGLAGNALTNYVASHAVIEAVPAAVMQRAGLGGLESFLGGKGAASKGVVDALKNLGIQTIQEIPEEVATELLHNAEDAITKVDPDATTPANLWKTAYQTTVQTLITLGFANAPTIGIHSIEGAANFLNVKSRSDAEKLGYGRTSKADRAEMMRLALNYFQQPKERTDALSQPRPEEVYADEQAPVGPQVVEGPRQETRPEEGGVGIRGSGQEEVVGQPEVVPPEAVEPQPVAETVAPEPLAAPRPIYRRNPEHEALARRAAAGEAVEKPPEISDLRWGAMVKQAALPPVEPVPVDELEPPKPEKRPITKAARGKKATAEENVRRFAAESGIDPDQFLQTAREIYRDINDIEEARRNAKRDSAKIANGLTVARIVKRGGDYDKIPGMDVKSERIVQEYPEAFDEEARQNPSEAVWELMKTPVANLQPIQFDDPGILSRAKREWTPPEPVSSADFIDAEIKKANSEILGVPEERRSDVYLRDLREELNEFAAEEMRAGTAFALINPERAIRIAVKAVKYAVAKGAETFDDLLEHAYDFLGEHFDKLKPTLFEAWNREADRNPKIIRAEVEESINFDFDTPGFMQGPVAPEKPSWKKTFEEAPEAKQAEIFDVGRGNLPGQESLFEKGTTGRPQAEWEREQAPPPQPPAPPSEPPRTTGRLPPGPDVTAARNAITEAITGIPHPPVDKTGHTHKELLEYARSVPERDVDALIERLKISTDTITDREEAVLTVRLKKVRDSQAKALEKGLVLNEAKATNDARVLQDILKRGGKAAARIMAFRQANIEPDWSLGHMLDGRQAAKGDVPVMWEEKQDIAQTVKNIEELEKEKERVAEQSFKPYADKEVDKAIAEAKAELPPDFDPKAHALGRRLLDWSRKQREEAMARIKARHAGTLYSGLDPRDLADAGIIGMSYLHEGFYDFGVWSKKMVEEMGEWIGPHLGEVLEEAKKREEGSYEKAAIPKAKKPAVKKEVAQRAKAPREELSPEEQLADISGKLQKRLNDKASVNYIVRKLMRFFAKMGIEKRDEMYEAVHNVFLGIDLNFTRKDVIGAVAGAGEWIPASSDKVDRQVANWRNEAQPEYNLLKLNLGEKTERFGRGRQLPSDEGRRLNRKLELEIRKRGINPEDDESQQRSILQSLKTQATHRTSDMQEAIDSGVRIPKNKTPRPTDAELQRLEEQEGITREAYLAKFEADIEIDRLEASAAYVEDQIARAKAGEDIWKGKAATPKARNDQINALQANMDALKAERDAMKAANAGVQARRAEAQEEAALRRIEELKAQLESGQLTKEGTKQPSLVSPETQAELNRLHERIKAARKAMDEADLAIWEGEGGTLKQRVPISEERRLAIAIQAKNAYTRRRIADYMSRRAAGEFGPRPIKRPPTWPKETLDLIVKLEKEKLAYERANLEWERKNRSLAGKGLGLLGDVSDSARLIQTGFEMSAVGRQGLFYTVGFPEYSIPAIWKAAKAVFSERLERGIHEDLANSENNVDKAIGKLDTTIATGPLTAREELVSSRLIDWLSSGKTAKYNLALQALLGSIRGFRTFNNIMRHDMFDYMKASVERNRTWVPEQDAPIVGENANIFSGRAKMQHAVGWGRVLYAPRWALSRVQLLVGKPLWKGDLQTRKAAAKVYIRGLLGASVYFALRHVWYTLMADDEEHEPKYEIDPRSADFGKMRIGKVRVDSSAGVGQYITLGSRLGTGTNKNERGEIVPITGPEVPRGNMDAWGAISGFARRKLAPGPSAAVDYLTEENAIGQPATPGSILRERFTPITWGDIFDAERELGVKQGTTAAIEAFFGMGVNTYQPREKKRSIRKRTR